MITHPNEKMSLTQLMESLLIAANGKSIDIREICHLLDGRGYGVLIALFSIPFCQPISLPGLSTPFGVLLAFLGLRVAFAKKLWWPDWILDKKVPYGTFRAVINGIVAVAKVLQKILRPRLTLLVFHPLMHRMHGLLIFFLAILLALPLPIPFTNMLTALPIFCLGLGLTEDDGVAILFAYVLASICFIVFGALFWFGSIGLQNIFSAL